MLAFAASIIASLAWIPIAVFFYHRWAERRNPLSVFIFGSCAATAAVSPYNALFLGRVSSQDMTLSIALIQIAMAVVFYWARWLARRYPDQRGTCPKCGYKRQEADPAA